MWSVSVGLSRWPGSLTVSPRGGRCRSSSSRRRRPARSLTLGRTIGELEALDPSFASVTYGAGGSDRRRTGDVVDWMRRETDIEPMAHLTCVGHTRTDVAALLVDYRRIGVENILALGGDPPRRRQPRRRATTRYALDLLHDVAATGCFSVGVAAHPEVHPRSPERASDRATSPTSCDSPTSRSPSSSSRPSTGRGS